MHSYQGRFAEASAGFARALEIGREHGDERPVARSISNLGEVALRKGAYTTARKYFTQNVERCERIGDSWSQLYTQIYLGEVAYYEGNLSSAREYGSGDLDGARALAAKTIEAWALRAMALLELAEENPASAAEYLYESLEISHWQGAKRDAATAMEICDELSNEVGRPETAANPYGAADAVRAVIGAVRSAGEDELYRRCLDEVEASLGASRAKHELAEGLMMAVDDAAALALAVAREA
jgi:tetratricopeptide (TPR) repeat protein